MDPGRVDQRLRQTAPQPNVSRSPAQPLAPDQQEAQASAAKFTVSSVAFEGATAMSAADLQRFAAPYVGREITLADAQTLARQITTEYRNRGLILSRAVVPPQSLDGGVLHIQIIEGYFSEVKVEGDAGGDRHTLEVYAQRIQAMKPVTADGLERLLLLANDLPGLTVRSVVTPSTTTPGAAVLTLVAEHKALDASLSADNRGNRWLGPLEGFASVDLYDLAGTGSRLGFTGALASNTELAYGLVSLDQPLGVDGLMLNLTASHARTRPGDELKAIDTHGTADTFTGALSYPLIRRRAENLYLQFGFTARDADSSNDLIDPQFNDKVRLVSAELSGNIADASRGVTSARVSVVHSLNIFDASHTSDPDKSRATAKGDFTRANFELIRPAAARLRFQHPVGRCGTTFLRQPVRFRGIRPGRPVLRSRLRPVRDHRRQRPGGIGGTALVAAKTGVRPGFAGTLHLLRRRPGLADRPASRRSAARLAAICGCWRQACNQPEATRFGGVF